MALRAFILLFLSFFATARSQTSRLTIHEKKAKQFFYKIKSSTLLIPVKDKTNHEDSALIEAISMYWKASPFKIISQTEFNLNRQSKIKTPGVTYLIKETYERLKYRRMDWAYTKFFLTTEPGGVEIMDAPYIEFKIPLKSRNKEVSIIDNSFIYGLVIKQLNYDISLIDNEASYYAIKRSALIRASFKKDLKAYASRTMLVAYADMENYMMNIPDKEKEKVQVIEFKKYISLKTKMDTSGIRLASEDEIKEAIYKSDTTVLVYTGFTVYDPGNGKMLRRIDVSSNKRKIHSAFTLSLSAIMIAAGALLLSLRV